ncbi:hypothetical protein M9Y10_045481 [Tritrichomonas musculus]|uniref:Peptidase C14 caspase domain-containing protein n=1 Tax=Tritrichomonas musculus TaxID=1915356 RepID=A0ABR2JW36_9EUKA
MTYIDVPNKKQKHPHYEHRTAKLDKQNQEFSKKAFQQLRKYSTHKKIIKALSRISMCVNDKKSENIQTDRLTKVCFILCNTYDRNDYNLGVGPLNDALMIASQHHRLGYEVFYLHNPRKTEFTNYCDFFLKNTQKSLTIFYSGRGKTVAGSIDGEMCSNINAIVFDCGMIVEDELSKILSQNPNGKAKITLITDSCNGGSPWNLASVLKENHNYNSKIVSLSISNNLPESETTAIDKKCQGLFTYYFCKYLTESPEIDPSSLCAKINPSLKRFNECVIFERTTKDLESIPLL